MLKEQDGRLKSSQLVLLTSLEPTKREEKKEVIFKKTSVNSENGDNHLTFPNSKICDLPEPALRKADKQPDLWQHTQKIHNYD